MGLFAALAVVVLYTAALPAMADYVAFMRVERTAYMKLPFSLVYAIYLLFAVAAIVRYLWLGFRAIRGDGEGSANRSGSGSGL